MSKSMLRSLRQVSPLHSTRLQARRTFIKLPGTEAQSFSATKILPYKSSSIYNLISDVDSYSSFVPYCLESKVTKWSDEDKNGQRWPSEADLKVGWGGYEETFTSRLFCVPGSIVEALCGDAVTDIPKANLSHHSASFDAPATANGIFQSLSTRWTVKPFHYKPPTGRPQTDKALHPAVDQTEVHLVLDFQFSNPIYGAVSKAVAPKVAGMMIEAFEIRARKVLEGPGSAIQVEESLNDEFSAAKKMGA